MPEAVAPAHAMVASSRATAPTEAARIRNLCFPVFVMRCPLVKRGWRLLRIARCGKRACLQAGSSHGVPAHGRDEYSQPAREAQCPRARIASSNAVGRGAGLESRL